MANKKEPRLTAPALKVLGFLLNSNGREISGAEIARETKLQSGTLYPILFRLEQKRWVESQWELGEPAELGRPRRRFYHLTGEGVRKTQAAFRDLSAIVGEVAWQQS